IAENEPRLKPVANQVFDRAGVRPGEQRVEVLSFAAHLLVELVVAFGRHDNHGPFLDLDDLPDIRRQAAKFAIRDQLAVADAEGAQQLRRPLVGIDPGGHQRTKEVAFASFIRADVGLGLGWNLGRGGCGRLRRRTPRSQGLPNRLRNSDRVVECRRVSGEYQLAGPIHDRGCLARPFRKLDPPELVRTRRKLGTSYGVQPLQKTLLVGLLDSESRGWTKFAGDQLEVHNSRLIRIRPLWSERGLRVTHDVRTNVEHGAIMLHEERQGGDHYERRAKCSEDQPKRW